MGLMITGLGARATHVIPLRLRQITTLVRRHPTLPLTPLHQVVATIWPMCYCAIVAVAQMLSFLLHNDN